MIGTGALSLGRQKTASSTRILGQFGQRVVPQPGTQRYGLRSEALDPPEGAKRSLGALQNGSTFMPSVVAIAMAPAQQP